eukprot:10678094-Alexandrium_andersonii.AAC.1
MSASLVGSEMCIRDSEHSAWVFPRSCSKTSQSPVLSSQAFQNGEAPSPVSYTHLTLPTICSV